MTDLLLADCFLPESPVMQGFFHETNEGVPAAGLVITVSNDGDHKSSENLTFISYDSACMSCNISTGCVLKVCQCSTKQRKPLVNIKLHCGFLISKCSKLNGPLYSLELRFGRYQWLKYSETESNVFGLLEFRHAHLFHGYYTRSRDLLRPPFAKTTKYQGSFRINGARTYNTLLKNH